MRRWRTYLNWAVRTRRTAPTRNEDHCRIELLLNARLVRNLGPHVDSFAFAFAQQLQWQRLATWAASGQGGLWPISGFASLSHTSAARQRHAGMAQACVAIYCRPIRATHADSR